MKNEIAKNEKNDDFQKFINKIIRIDNRQHEKKFEKKKYKIYSSKQDNKVNIKFIYYKFMSIEFDVICYKEKLSFKDFYYYYYTPF